MKRQRQRESERVRNKLDRKCKMDLMVKHLIQAELPVGLL